jgi:hypothetical protein
MKGYQVTQHPITEHLTMPIYLFLHITLSRSCNELLCIKNGFDCPTKATMAAAVDERPR